ncbi:MAG: ribonuclease P protein component [Chloroflexi bacterium]|nr:ribonuclease P protein component [Chloroflexota bacterium]
MRREQRLRRAADFAGVYRRGRAWSDSLLVVKLLPNRTAANRFGFAVGKKLGNAVVRNRVKRRLREIVRLMSLNGGWDVVVIAKAPAAAAEFAGLRVAVADLFRRARLIRTETGTAAGTTPAPRRPAGHATAPAASAPRKAGV